MSTGIENIYAHLTGSRPDTAVSVIRKIRGKICDISCPYCYEQRKEAPGGTRVEAADLDRLTSTA
ncbi:hypothetical protein DPM19_09655 [Actinomadura craniellae]|uniref:Radical SAM protein n=1 Tax=Actinomadura craniellae TaxID=2231787 RepID=A0A365H7Q9_9ACTN|nr:hypothetical protein [Actinomadura craniellae]RAY15006.1 hypothetical protein DPM19_09655 [Actinomadura craniellae]